MDITFEEVANVIQDARYQQAMVSDIPIPDKKQVPQPPRGFNAEDFAIENNIGLHSVLAEPLGRWFLLHFADGYTDVYRTPARLEKLSNLGSRKKRNGDRPESLVEEKAIPIKQRSKHIRFLEFADELFDLKRCDPAAIVPFPEVNRLLEKFFIELPKLNNLVNNASSTTTTPRTSTLSPESYAAVAAANSNLSIDISSSGEPKESSSLNTPPETPDDNNTSPAGIKLDESMTALTDVKVNMDAVEENNAFETNTKYTEKTQTRNTQDLPTADNTAGSETVVTRYDEQVAREYKNKKSTYTPNTYSANTVGALSRVYAKTNHSRTSLELSDIVAELLDSELQQVYERFKANSHVFSHYCKLKWYSQQLVTEKQVKYHRVLGMGAFGTVHGCFISSIGCLLAMKIMNKKKIKAKRARSQVAAERQALEALAAHPSPYCMQLRYAFTSKDAFHLVLPLAIGGDLKYHLQDGGPFDEERAKIYAAEVAVGLGHIHALGLIIRDLKPRNILLDSDGHCKISDLGLAASVGTNKSIRGRAGTEGYWSPEVINNLHYSTDADWWSYGCCVFEFHAGFNPFSCKHTGLKTRNEGTRRAVIIYPPSIPTAAKTLIGSLLKRKVEDRLGNKSGIDDIMAPNIAYWRNVDLAAVKRGTVESPWTPKKGVIYAASQMEMIDNDEDNDLNLKKIKLTAEDEPDFTPFVDVEDHQKDIIRMLDRNDDFYNTCFAPPIKKGKSQRTKSAMNDPRADNACCTVT